MAEKRKRTLFHKFIQNRRLWVQTAFTALSNGYLIGFLEGKIYTGNLKSACFPGLNCYSCPGALGSCPVGALQASLNNRGSKLSFYIIGFLLAIGAFLGRFVCGWLCPFGLFQDLLHKIPFIKKIRKLPGDRYLKLVKYFILAVFVILLPLFAVDAYGASDPWFCKYICPSGTLMGGWPLAIVNPEIRSVIGWLFAWKSMILIALIMLSVITYRPFCRYLCPLGAIYSFFNPIALYRYKLDSAKCTKCKVCQSACPMDIPVHENPNSLDCIRCGKCRSACPHSVITSTFSKP